MALSRPTFVLWALSTTLAVLVRYGAEVLLRGNPGTNAAGERAFVRGPVCELRAFVGGNGLPGNLSRCNRSSALQESDRLSRREQRPEPAEAPAFLFPFAARA